MNGNLLWRVLVCSLLVAVPWAVADMGVSSPPGVGLYEEGTRLGQVQRLDCVGAGIACTRSDITGTLTVSSTGAPTDATYLTQTANGTLTAEQALASLATGFMKVTTGTGVVSSQVDIALTTDTSGNYVASVATTSPITGGAAGSEGAALTLACATCGVTGSPLSQFAATTSAQLAGVMSDETGSGLLAFATSPVLTTPDINAGTVDSITSLSIRSTGAAFDLTFATDTVFTAGRTLTIRPGDAARILTFTGDATISGTNTGDQTITLTGDVTGSGTGSFAATIAAQTSATWAGKVSDETGTGLWVFGTSPTLTTPTLRTSATVDTATATDDRIVVSVTAGGLARFDGTVTAADLTAARTYTLPDLGGTVALTVNNLSVFAATTSAQLAGVLSDETGTGLAVFGTSPVLTTPDINAGTVDSLTSLSIRSTGAAFDLTLATDTVFTAGRTLTIRPGDVARILTFTGDATISGTNTGDQTITLTGDVTGSGTGSFAATITAQTSVTWAGKVSDETGTGLWVFGTSPTLTTPTIRTSGAFDTATGTDDRIVVSVTTGGLARFDGTVTAADLTAARTYTLPDLGGTVALTANNLSVFAATTSAQLLGVLLDETGTGLAVFGTSPTITTPTIRTTGTFDTATATDDRIVISPTAGGVARFDLTLTVADLTAARTVTFPDAASNTVRPLTCTGTDKVSAIAATGVITCTADAGGGGASLDAITAAVADQAGIANADFSVRWNWAKTTDSEIGLRLSESAASTAGTSTAGVPNQVLLQLDTLVPSTMSPLKVLSRGSHVFSVSPTAAQILATNGSAANPVYGFASDLNTGMYLIAADNLILETGGVGRLDIRNTILILSTQVQFPTSGTAASPTLTDGFANDTGINMRAADTIAFATNGVEQWTMNVTGHLISTGVAFASLGTPANGSIIYCTDCTIANPCAGGGTGALAKRLNAAWICN